MWLLAGPIKSKWPNVRTWSVFQYPVTYTKSQGIEYHRLSQQWDQLAVCGGVLWRHVAHPNQDQSWLQLVVPQQIHSLILEALHQGIGSGYLGQQKTLGFLKERFYWAGHFRDVHNWYESCISCTTRKTPAPGQRAALGNIAAGYPMQIVATDLMGPLPESDNRNKYILVVTDYILHPLGGSISSTQSAGGKHSSYKVG